MLFYRFSKYFLGVAIVLLAGCLVDESGPESTPSSFDGTTSTAAVTPSMTILFTDAPCDEFSEVNLTISKMELIGDNGSRVILYSGMRTINLLGLRNYSNLFAVHDNVPLGLYNKIRMYLDDVELVRADANGNVTERIHPQLPANGKLDLNPRTQFAIGPGKSMVLQIDMDAKKSIHVIQNGKGKSSYKFRPVVFVDVVDFVNFGGKLVRVSGDITDINYSNQSVEVCYIDGFSTNQCMMVNVEVGDGTTIYDGVGQPITLAAAQINKRGVAIGRMLMANGHRVLDAEVLQVGNDYDFWHVSGSVTSPPVDASNEFYFGIDPGQSFKAGLIFRVSPLPGAKLFSSQGEPLDWTAISVGKIVEIEGVLHRTIQLPLTFKASVVYLDMSQIQSHLDGTVSNVDINNSSFNIASLEYGDVCVVAAQSVNIYLMSNNGDSGYSGKRVGFDQLASGQSADVYGDYGTGGCYVASDILIVN